MSLFKKTSSSRRRCSNNLYSIFITKISFTTLACQSYIGTKLSFWFNTPWALNLISTILLYHIVIHRRPHPCGNSKRAHLQFCLSWVLDPVNSNQRSLYQIRLKSKDWKPKNLKILEQSSKGPKQDTNIAKHRWWNVLFKLYPMSLFKKTSSSRRRCSNNGERLLISLLVVIDTDHKM
jgi:hypothetical protein